MRLEKGPNKAKLRPKEEFSVAPRSEEPGVDAVMEGFAERPNSVYPLLPQLLFRKLSPLSDAVGNSCVLDVLD